MANISKINFKGVEYNIKPLMDATPTANSTNAVQSGGVKTALDGLQAEIPTVDAVPTQGSNNAVRSGGVYSALADVNSDVADLDLRVEDLEQSGTGGLTAEVKSALLACFRGVAWETASAETLYTNLVNALDNNDPQYTYYNVGQNLTHVTSSYTSASIRQGSALTATLYPASDYVMDAVTVYMGSTDITSTSYNSATNTISIASVTGDVTITATAVASHVQNGLLYRWVGGDADGTTWTDRASDAVINLTNVTKSGKALIFNGSSSYGVGLIGSAPSGAKTIEVVCNAIRKTGYIVVLTEDATVSVGSQSRIATVSATQPSTNMPDYSVPATNTIRYDATTYDGTFDASGFKAYYNGVAQAVRNLSRDAYFANKHGGIEVGAHLNAEGTPTGYYFNGNIYEIRIYNRALTAEEIAHNYSIDADNYGIGA